MSSKNKIRVLGVLALILLVIFFIMSSSGNKDEDKEYFVSLSYKGLMKLIDGEEDFVLCVSATTCSHCASYKPKLKEVAQEYQIRIYYTDIDLYSNKEQEKFKNKFNIGGTPMTLFFIDGEEESIMTRLSGDNSKDKIVTSLKKHGFIEE